MLKLHSQERIRPPTGTSPSRFQVLETALADARADLSLARRRNADLLVQLERLRAENRHLRVSVDQRMASAASQPRAYAVRELTAGTCEGPRRSPASKPPGARERTEGRYKTDHIPVKDVMHDGRSNAPVGEVAAIMAERRVHAIAITNGPGARPPGVVSDLDVINASTDSAEAGAELAQKASLNAQPRTCSRTSTRGRRDPR